ncbi:hypothetical protein [Hyalangium rubrum]|uniref:Uncharacterized protein n=1 Tax=Hyalangium rubrum TaxID=3103134 RepID=A0ABU5HF99_9BACT|nr:hypothetical protein [Hyalangium sp. s54d21]MDY7232144.1 hypothetical protein [Hyalangium sp. s54d21]
MSETEALVAVMTVGMVCGVPILGLTLRFSLKPLVDAYIRLREAQLASSQMEQLRERVAYLERELERRGLMERPPAIVSQLSMPESVALQLKDRERS